VPHGEVQIQDKRHLYAHGGEDLFFQPAHERHIFEYKGVKILLLVCYDLRFPVWLRNTKLRYDVLAVIAEWPSNRQYIFEHLLVARAIENQAYVCACNRVGKDDNHLQYTGGSQVIDYRGRVIERLTDHQEEIKTIVLEKEPLLNMRQKAPIWRHADSFEIKE
ncbi:MAG: nitrilase-related carbon-nitrogen hydrolase, partial [Paludibacteraceae bacterium]|nr:nitrilase-related carbon-nitrogen hydrolase [Paludibacteraceae bacterium]